MIFPYVASDPVKESIMTVHSRKELGEMTVLKEVPKQDFRTNFQGASSKRKIDNWSSGEDGDSSSSGEDGDMLELSSSDGEDEGLPVGLVEYHSRRQQSGAPAYFASVS